MARKNVESFSYNIIWRGGGGLRKEHTYTQRKLWKTIRGIVDAARNTSTMVHSACRADDFHKKFKVFLAHSRATHIVTLAEYLMQSVDDKLVKFIGMVCYTCAMCYVCITFAMLKPMHSWQAHMTSLIVIVLYRDAFYIYRDTWLNC